MVRAIAAALAAITGEVAIRTAAETRRSNDRFIAGELTAPLIFRMSAFTDGSLDYVQVRSSQ
jgi:hypothetical protein